MATVALLGTCDTKLHELLFLRDRIERTGGVKALLIDVGWKAVDHEAIAVSPAQLIAKHADAPHESGLGRGDYLALMARCASKAVRELAESGAIDAVASAGGSGGTAVASAAMRDAVPLGFPKLMVSTMASGDTTRIVGETDMMMMNPVVDVAGLNHILRNALSNAGAAIAAAALAHAADRCDPRQVCDPRKRVGITMFGVTTPGADALRAHLESSYGVDVFVFHATGQGGRAMERLVRAGELDAVVDLTTTEICDLVMGGVMSAGHDRLDAAANAGIPAIISLGATDMANFGPRDTVPDRYKSRNLLEHNPTVTLVRSSKSECQRIGQFILEKLSRATKPDNIQVWIPKGGVSALAVPGAAFADPDADQAMFDVLKEGLKESGIKVVEDPRHINDAGFARDIADALMAIMCPS